MNNARRARVFIELSVCCVLSAAFAFGEEPQARLTLKQAVALAVQSSSEVALARARYSVAEQGAALAHAPFGPNLFAGSGAGYTYGFPMTPGGAAPALFNLSYIQTLFNPPLKGEARAAERRAEVERLTLERSRDAVILRTAAVFLNLVQVRQALDARRGTRDAIRRIQDITDSRIAEGHELPVESLRAKLSAARAEQAIVELEGREDALATELRELTGIPGDRPLDIVPDSLVAQPEQPLVELVAHALTSNTELQQAKYEQRARTDRLKGERGGYWPAVDIVGEYAMLARFNNYDEFFRQFQRHNLNVGIQARWSILSAQTMSAVRLAEAKLRQTEIELRRKREEIEVTVRRASQRSRELNTARNIAALELELAEENVRMLDARFHEDRANLRDVERARLDKTDKRVAFLKADYESQEALLALLNTTGQIARLFPAVVPANPDLIDTLRVAVPPSSLIP